MLRPDSRQCRRARRPLESAVAHHNVPRGCSVLATRAWVTLGCNVAIDDPCCTVKQNARSSAEMFDVR